MRYREYLKTFAYHAGVTEEEVIKKMNEHKALMSLIMPEKIESLDPDDQVPEQFEKLLIALCVILDSNNQEAIEYASNKIQKFTDEQIAEHIQKN